MNNYVRLGDVFEFTNGRAFKKSEWGKSGLPIIRIQNLNNPAAAFNYFSGEYDKRIEVSNGDLLFSWSGTVGSSFGPHLWYRGKGVLNQHIFRVGFKDSIDKRYAYYALLEITSEIEKSVNGAVGIVHVTQKNLKNFQILIPPLSQQKRIVAILDEAFAGIEKAVANTEKNLANVRELFNSYLNSIFAFSIENWPIVTISDCSILVSTGPFGSLLHKSDYVSDGIPVVNPINIVQSEIVPDENKLVSSKTQERLKAYILQEGDVVVARRGEIGRCAVIGKVQSGWVCGTGCFFIRPKAEVDSYFLAMLIQSHRYRRVLEDQATGTTMNNLSNKTLAELRIRLPSKAKQESIIEMLRGLSQQTSNLESIYQQKLATLSELKQSLLRKAFSGELTAEDRNVKEAAA